MGARVSRLDPGGEPDARLGYWELMRENFGEIKEVWITSMLF